MHLNTAQPRSESEGGGFPHPAVNPKGISHWGGSGSDLTDLCPKQCWQAGTTQHDFMEMKKIKSPKAAQWPIRPGGTVSEAGVGEPSD